MESLPAEDQASSDSKSSFQGYTEAVVFVLLFVIILVIATGFVKVVPYSDTTSQKCQEGTQETKVFSSEGKYHSIPAGASVEYSYSYHCNLLRTGHKCFVIGHKCIKSGKIMDFGSMSYAGGTIRNDDASPCAESTLSVVNLNSFMVDNASRGVSLFGNLYYGMDEGVAKDSIQKMVDRGMLSHELEYIVHEKISPMRRSINVHDYVGRISPSKSDSQGFDQSSKEERQERWVATSVHMALEPHYFEGYLSGVELVYCTYEREPPWTWRMTTPDALVNGEHLKVYNLVVEKYGIGLQMRRSEYSNIAYVSVAGGFMLTYVFEWDRGCEETFYNCYRYTSRVLYTPISSYFDNIDKLKDEADAQIEKDIERVIDVF